MFLKQTKLIPPLASFKNVSSNTHSLIFQNIFFSPPSMGNMREFFPGSHCENLFELLEIKPPKVWGLPVTRSPWSFESLRHVHTRPPAVHQLYLRFPTLALVPEEVCANGFLLQQAMMGLRYWFLQVWGSGLSCDHISLMDLRRIVNFYVYSAFYLLG